MACPNSCHICHLQLSLLLADLAFALGNSFNYHRTFLHWGDDDDDGPVAGPETETESSRRLMWPKHVAPKLVKSFTTF